MRTLCETLDKPFRIYNKANFYVTKFYVDPEFKCLCNTMADIDIELITAGTQDHISGVERTIGLVEEHYRAIYH